MIWPDGKSPLPTPHKGGSMMLSMSLTEPRRSATDTIAPAFPTFSISSIVDRLPTDRYSIEVTSGSEESTASASFINSSRVAHLRNRKKEGEEGTAWKAGNVRTGNPRPSVRPLVARSSLRGGLSPCRRHGPLPRLCGSSQGTEHYRSGRPLRRRHVSVARRHRQPVRLSLRITNNQLHGHVEVLQGPITSHHVRSKNTNRVRSVRSDD